MQSQLIMNNEICNSNDKAFQGLDAFQIFPKDTSLRARKLAKFTKPRKKIRFEIVVV
jgi:hypothetical protein